MKPLAFKYGKGKQNLRQQGAAVQPKLSVNTPGDRFEQEADAVAQKVVRQEDTGMIAKSLRKKTPDIKNKNREEQVMRKTAGCLAPSCFHSSLENSKGQPMPRGVRSFMENSFSRDFSAVRLHTGAEAAALSSSIGAKAFTHGADIYFNSGQYAPDTPEGKKLLAHELTHVVQQSESGNTPDLQRSIELRPPGPGEASAFDRVPELIDRMNAQSPAVQYRLEGNMLASEIIDEAAMTHFDNRIVQFVRRNEVVRLRLVTREARGRRFAGARFELIPVDFFDAGYVDLEDLLATDDLSFQTNLLHILAERFSVPGYTRRIGTFFSDEEFNRAHVAGLEEEADNFTAVFNDPSIRFNFAERIGRRLMIVFRSAAEGYRVFVLFPDFDAPLARSEVRVRTQDGDWFSGEEFRRRRAAAGAGPPLVQPKLMVNKAGDEAEREADAVAETVVNHSNKKIRPPRLRQPAGAIGSPAPSFLEPGLNQSKENGHVLPEVVREQMETLFHTNFSSVRIHTDQWAVTMSEQIGANAFTHGRDIFFNSGQYSPWSVDGKRLLAHELVHVVQQGADGPAGSYPASAEQQIQRDEKEKPTEEPAKWFVLPQTTVSGKDGKVETGGEIDVRENKKFILLYKVKIARQLKKFINTAHYTTIPIRGERPTDQREIWKRQSVDKKVLKKIEEKGQGHLVKDKDGGPEYYFFKTRQAGSSAKPVKGGKKKFYRDYIIGTAEEIGESMKTPTWNKEGLSMDFDVDHEIEWQIGGKHEMSNFWLWESSANRSAGSKLNNYINKQIEYLVTAAIDAGSIWKVPKRKKKETFIDEWVKKIRKTFSITIRNLDPDLEVNGRVDDHYESYEVFEQGLPLQGLEPMSKTEIDQLQGNKSSLAVMFGNSVSRNPKKVPKSYKGYQKNWIRGFDLLEVTDYNVNAKAGEDYAYLRGMIFRRQKESKLMKMAEVKVPVKKVPGPLYFGKIPGRMAEFITDDPVLTPFSPIQVSDAYINETEGVVMAGKVLPTFSLLRDFDIDVLITGDDIVLQKTFFADEIGKKFPKQFTITAGEITLSLGLQQGLGFEGELEFTIGKLGTGRICGISKKGLFALEGEFEFDKGLFDESKISLRYEKEEGREEGKLSFSGRAVKKSSKENKAIKSAAVDVNYENEVLTAKGEAETSLAAIPKGAIQIITGGPVTSVEADFTIGNAIRGVSGGHLHLLFQKMEDGSYQIAADAAVQTDFPAIPAAALKGIYKSDGTFLFEGEALLKKDRFSGSVHFGITNQEVNENGELTGKKGDSLIAFGRGEVFYQINKWLGGKIEVTVTPEAKVILGGEIRPDPMLPLKKDPYSLTKTLGSFNLPKFTLFGIPRVAEVFVTASGGIYLFARLGPVYLKDGFLKVENLDIEQPQSAVITGGGKIDIPAEAGLTLSVTIRAGVGILVVDVSLFLTGSISFVVRGDAGIEVRFTWSVDKGFEMDKLIAYLKAKSELVGKLSGGVRVDLDLLLTTINLYKKEWDFGEKVWPLGFNIDYQFPLAMKGDGDELQLPDKDQVEPPKQEFDKETIKQAAIDDPPSVSAAPAKEETLNRIRILRADATVGSNLFANLYERYSYVKALKKEYPSQDWRYLDAELPALDSRDLRKLKGEIFEVQGLFGRSATEMRLLVLSKFEEEHRYLQPGEVAELKNRIYEAGRKAETEA